MKKIFLLSLITSAFLFADNVSSTPCENIQSLKTAVAKLIVEQEKLKIQNQDNEQSIKNLQEKLNTKEQKALSALTPDNELVKKPSCITKTIKVLNKDFLKFSYLKMDEKEFKILTSNVLVYEYPYTESSSIGELKRGEKFIGDMYTAGGWVHNKNGGWLKGYLLKPKIEQDKNIKGGQTAYMEKVVGCESETKEKGDNK